MASKDSLRLLVCSHYLAEARAVLRAEGYEDVQAAAYPDVCAHPANQERAREGLKIEAHAGTDTVILGLCGMFHDQDLPAEIQAYKVQREETCFTLFAPAEMVRRFMAAGAHLLTPGWLSGWSARLRAWGFDQPTAREFFREGTRKLVLLDTGVLPGAEGILEEMAAYLDLPAELVPVGLDHFRLHVRLAVSRWRSGREQAATEAQMEQNQRRLASHAMALDLLASLARTMSEEEAIQAILELLSILMGARRVTWLPLGQDRATLPARSDGTPVDPDSAAELERSMAGEAKFARTGQGFCLRVRYQDRDLALVAVEDLEFRQHREEYVNLALSVSNLLGLIIANARSESRRRQAEADLKAQSVELERSNAELTHFAYVISHDLQEPLRTITGFLDLLARRCGEQLDEKAQGYIHYTVDGAARMKRLIEDLLSYSRISTHAEEPVTVDLNQTMEAVQGNLRAALEASGASFTCDPLPTASAEPTQMLQLLQNLVGNALKFRGEAPPEVHVSAAEEGEMIQVSVRDNGIGMEMARAEQVFKIFQRLHNRTEYEGTGIGLAVCKRIVERHGGRIWVESAPGEGATFHFSLPRG